MSNRKRKAVKETIINARIRGEAARKVLADPAAYGARNKSHAVEMALDALHKAKFPVA